MPASLLKKCLSGFRWTFVISTFAFLFLWQMTRTTMPVIKGFSAGGPPVSGPFADSPSAIVLTIAFFGISAVSLVGTIIATLVAWAGAFRDWQRSRSEKRESDPASAA